MAEAAARGRELGLGIQSDKGIGAYAELATAAERAGIDVLSVFADLLYQPPLPALLEMARATTGVRLGAACWNPFTMHPYELVGQWAALDAASGGRAYLGLARGSWLDRIGVDTAGAVSRLREAVGFARALVAGQPFQGRHFQLEPSTLRYPLVRTEIPVLLGAWGPQGMRLAGEVADQLKVGGTANPAMAALARDRLDRASVAAGRPAGSVRLVVGAVSVVDPDGAAARRLARREVALYLPVVAALDPTLELPEGLVERLRTTSEADGDEAAGALIPTDVLRLFTLAGTPDEVAAQVSELFAAGADRVELGTPHGADPTAAIRLVGERVLPALRP